MNAVYGFQDQFDSENRMRKAMKTSHSYGTYYDRDPTRASFLYLHSFVINSRFG